LKRQIRDAIKFLSENETEIVKLTKTEGLDEPPELDFAVNRSNAFTESYRFPAGFVAAAGRMGLSIVLSQYPVEEEKKRHLTS
jgi:hypothetical protein